jgi:hypothetical protein
MEGQTLCQARFGNQEARHDPIVTALPPSLIIPFRPPFPLSVLESVANRGTLRILFHFPLFFSIHPDPFFESSYLRNRWIAFLFTNKTKFP